MPKMKKPMSPSALSLGLGVGVSVEIKKSRLGAVMLVSGVMSITEISDEFVSALSHSGRIFIFGERLSVSILENRTLSVYGRITGIEMSYGGKNAKA